MTTDLLAATALICLVGLAVVFGLLHLAATAPFPALALDALDALPRLTAPALADTG